MAHDSTQHPDLLADTLPLGLVPKARGAQSNASGRFERLARETFIDGWDAELEQTIFRSDHVSNRLVLKGTLGKDKARMLAEIEAAIGYAAKHSIPLYQDSGF